MSLHTAFDPDSTAQGLIDFVDASPTPFHAVDSAIRLLAAEGFTALDESAPFPSQPGRYYIARGGALVAWIETGGMPPTAPSGSSAPTPTRPICGSNHAPTWSRPAGRWWLSSPMAGC